MHKVIILAIGFAVVGVTVFTMNARRTVASEQDQAAMPSIQKLMADAKDMPQQSSYPAF
jgi:hypothetical protein